MKEIRVEIHGPFQNLETPETFAISLNESDNNRGCLITIGEHETKNIVFAKKKIQLPRPVTYDLLKNIIDKLAAKVEKVVITEYRESENTYFSIIKIITENNKKIEIDARPSDAVNLALRVKCPVFINEELLNKVCLLKDTETLINNPNFLDNDIIAEWFQNLDPDKIPKE